MIDVLSEMPMSALLWVHAASTWYMVGLIWFVQLVHYPLKVFIAEDVFVTYQQQHMQRTTYAVGPAMLIEAGTTMVLCLIAPQHLVEMAWFGAVLLGIIWLTTAVFQVPLHQRLSQGKNMEHIRALVRTNMIRTIAWTGRGVVVCSMVIDG